MNDKDLNSNSIPFFARYLEGQMQIEDVSESEAEALAGGGCNPLTEKYPSDCEEDGTIIFPDLTKKYPSDSDEDGVMTLKFPSDNDE